MAVPCFRGRSQQGGLDSRAVRDAASPACSDDAVLATGAVGVELAAVARIHAGDAGVALGPAADAISAAAESEQRAGTTRFRAAIRVTRTRGGNAGPTWGETRRRAETASTIRVAVALVDDTHVLLIDAGCGGALQGLCGDGEALAFAAVGARATLILQ